MVDFIGHSAIKTDPRLGKDADAGMKSLSIVEQGFYLEDSLARNKSSFWKIFRLAGFRSLGWEL